MSIIRAVRLVAAVKAHVSRVMAKLAAGIRVQVAITVRDAGLAQHSEFMADHGCAA